MRSSRKVLLPEKYYILFCCLATCCCYLRRLQILLVELVCLNRGVMQIYNPCKDMKEKGECERKALQQSNLLCMSCSFMTLMVE